MFTAFTAENAEGAEKMLAQIDAIKVSARAPIGQVEEMSWDTSLHRKV
jgi:hypothetical protein